MTNVSHTPLKNNTQNKIQSQFADFLGSLSSPQAAKFFASFLTESEQIMFTKRLAIIMMLEEQVPYSHIAKVLNVSPATVDRLDKKRQNGEFDDFSNLFQTKKRRHKFWENIRILIDENVHHYGASGWRWLDRIHDLEE